jgi:hypothetical protein
MDGSKRSSHGNAYFTGIGKNNHQYSPMAFIKYKMPYNNGAPITKANIKPLIISLTSVPTVVLLKPNFEFKPLENQELKVKIDNLLERTGFKSDGIFVMDGSKRSSHGNAYFTGIGKNKRIVFFDTLLKGMEDKEVEAILAHELGHFHHLPCDERLEPSMTKIPSLLKPVRSSRLSILTLSSWFSKGLNLLNRGAIKVGYSHNINKEKPVSNNQTLIPCLKAWKTKKWRQFWRMNWGISIINIFANKLLFHF